jgi:two-component system phosphate regulon response regulator PhoB
MSGLVLIVDDEKDLANAIDFHLQREGFTTRVAYDGTSALAFAEAERPDLVILDLMLPDVPGTEVCRRMRAMETPRPTAILMLTARSEEIDRVVGFEVGADDYMTKPFSMRELGLRVRAILRRTQEGERPSEHAAINLGVVRIDLEAHRAYVAGEEVRLTALEFRLLALFVQRRGRVQTRETLLSDVWGIEADVTTRTVDTHVKRLREKLGSAGDYIETIRGVGYRFLAEPPAKSA